MNDKLLELELESLKDGLLFSERFYKKPIVIFNGASQCGFTKQLEDFQKLYQEGKLVPISLPTNEFGQQEPGDDYEITQFYRTKYNVSFPVCKKTDLKHKLFQKFGLPDWNFNKYLFDKNHNFIKKFDAYFDPKQLVNYV